MPHCSGGESSIPTASSPGAHPSTIEAQMIPRRVTTAWSHVPVDRASPVWRRAQAHDAPRCGSTRDQRLQQPPPHRREGGSLNLRAAKPAALTRISVCVRQAPRPAPRGCGPESKAITLDLSERTCRYDHASKARGPSAVDRRTSGRRPHGRRLRPALSGLGPRMRGGAIPLRPAEFGWILSRIWLDSRQGPEFWQLHPRSTPR